MPVNSLKRFNEYFKLISFVQIFDENFKYSYFSYIKKQNLFDQKLILSKNVSFFLIFFPTLLKNTGNFSSFDLSNGPIIFTFPPEKLQNHFFDYTVHTQIKKITLHCKINKNL